MGYFFVTKKVKICYKKLGKFRIYSYIYYIRMRDMKIKEFYLEAFPTDDLGLELNEKPTFAGLLNQLIVGGDVYQYIGVGDSIIRERLFERLAEELEVSYDYVYNLWLK